MRIGIIGTGWLGGTVGRQWVKAGHQVLFSSRHPECFKTLVRELGSLASAGTAAEAAASGPGVLIATPCNVLPAIGRDHGEALRGKIMPDATNTSPSAPLARGAKRDGFAPTSAKLPHGTRLV
jgi:predicted dinucleotide-binding enzyme